MEQQKKFYINDVLVLLIGLLLSIILYYHIVSNGYYLPKNLAYTKYLVKLFVLTSKNILYVRLLFCFSIILGVVLIPRFKKGLFSFLGIKKKIFVFPFFFLFIFIIINGYSQSVIYNKIIYPLIILLYFPVTTFCFSNYNILKEEKNIFGINKLRNKFSFRLRLKNNSSLFIFKPFYHIWVEGSSGSGKSDSILKAILIQACEKNMSGLIYDVEGNPLKKNNPILGQIAYNTILQNKKRYSKNSKEPFVNFAFLNFNDLTRTVRVNVFSKRYVKNQSDVLNIVDNFVTNLMRKKDGGSGNSDFWDKYGVSLIKGIALRLYKNYNNYLTLPHIIAIATSADEKKLFKWLSADVEIQPVIASLLSAYNNKAQTTLASALVSAQVPLGPLAIPEIFWVLSKDEFNLDVSNKEDPRMLVIGNDSNMINIYAPAISVIIATIMKMLNAPDKHPSIFLFDEFPTVLIDKIDYFISTVRKHNVSVVLGVQDFMQASRDYGDKNAQVLRTNCNNQFFGRTSSDKTIRYIISNLGTIQKEKTSLTESTDNVSHQLSLQNEKIMQEREIASLKTGEFLGKIADGKPAFFKLLFKKTVGKSTEIPQFSNYITTNKEKVNTEILNTLAKKNYFKIIEEANYIISS